MSVVPTGGVNRPMAMPYTSRTPKWTGSIWSWKAMGANTDPRRMMAGATSITVPVTRQTMAMMASSIVGEGSYALTDAASDWGIRLNARSHDTTDAVAMTSSTTEVCTPVSYKAWRVFRQVSSR